MGVARCYYWYIVVIAVYRYGLGGIVCRRESVYIAFYIIGFHIDLVPRVSPIRVRVKEAHQQGTRGTSLNRQHRRACCIALNLVCFLAS
jgi:hypothetical protein